MLSWHTVMVDANTFFKIIIIKPLSRHDFVMLNGLISSRQLQTEDLLINSSSGEPSLFTDAPVSVWIRRQQRHNNPHCPQENHFLSPCVPKTASC